ncbi:MAG: hypothetical protein ACLPUO_18650, partial [Streptosporangiaceae bacterium]
PRHGWHESTTVETNPRSTSDHQPLLAGYFSPGLAQRVRHASGITKLDALRDLFNGHTWKPPGLEPAG